MKIVVLILFSLVAFTDYSLCQNVDSVYLDKAWKMSTQANHKYLRIAHQDSDFVRVTDYSKSGSIIGTGYYRTFDYNEKIGPYYYFKRNKVTYLELYDPNNYPEIVSKYKDFLSSNTPQADSLNLMIVFHKNGKIKATGYFSLSKEFYGTWSYFNKDEYLLYQYDYWKSSPNGPVKFYINNKVFVSGQYENGKMVGEWIRNDIRGNLKRIEYYQNGKLIKRIRY